MAPPPGASPPMRMTASWLGPQPTYRIQILCSGRENSGKSTSPITEPRERSMYQATTLPAPQTSSRGDWATLFVSLELSRSTWVATALAPRSSKMSKYTLVGGDGHKLLDLLARLKSRAEQRIAAPVKVVTITKSGSMVSGFIACSRPMASRATSSIRRRLPCLDVSMPSSKAGPKIPQIAGVQNAVIGDPGDVGEAFRRLRQRWHQGSVEAVRNAVPWRLAATSW